ncbi:hypothetical protein Dimus_006690 [Dionaea muscipula]
MREGIVIIYHVISRIKVMRASSDTNCPPIMAYQIQPRRNLHCSSLLLIIATPSLQNKAYMDHKLQMYKSCMRQGSSDQKNVVSKPKHLLANTMITEYHPFPPTTAATAPTTKHQERNAESTTKHTQEKSIPLPAPKARQRPSS